MKEKNNYNYLLWAPEVVKKLNVYEYIKLMFYTKELRKEANSEVYHTSAFFVFLLGFGLLFLYIKNTSIPLNEMLVAEGKIIETNYSRKGPATFSLLLKNDKIKVFYMYTVKKTREKLNGENVKIWYEKTKELFGESNKIVQVYVNGKPFRVRGDKYLLYDYELRVVKDRWFVILGILFILIGVYLTYIEWMLNKEILKNYKDNKER